MLQLSKIQPINHPEEFFDASEVLFVDVLRLSGFESNSLANNPRCFYYEGMWFYILIVIETPANFFFKNDPIPLVIGDANGYAFTWDRNIRRDFSRNCFYKLSDVMNDLSFIPERETQQFLLSRYVLPYSIEERYTICRNSELLLNYRIIPKIKQVST